MDAKTLVKVMKQVVREEMRSVIKQELTEILREGLHSTVNELNEQVTPPPPPKKKNKVKFNRTNFSDILNETESLREQSPYTQLNEDISMTSANAMGFGALREKMRSQISGIESVPEVIQDPESGRNLKVDPIVAKAMTRDYTALMRAMDEKKGKK